MQKAATWVTTTEKRCRMIKMNPEEEREFQDIYAQFNEKIKRYLARMVNKTEAEDLTQEVFVKVGRGLKDFRGRSSLSTWIYKIAANTALDRLRALSSQAGASDLLPEDNKEQAVESADRSPSPELSLIKREMNDCIRGIVEGLQDRYRTVLLLSEFEELTNAEIAEVLGISADAVKIRLHRARTRLREQLKVQCSLYRDERNELACEPASPPLIFLKP